MDTHTEGTDRCRTNRAAPTGQPSERLLVAEEVAELLQVTTAWVYRETRANRLPHVRLGRYVRYRRTALEQWLARAETTC